VADPPRLLYVSFDEVPSPKGASTHIAAFARGIGARYGSLILVTPGPQDVPVLPLAPGVRQIVLGCPDDNLIGRALTFRARLLALLARQTFDLIHFRSIFEGYPLALHKDALGARLLYEVNGFPSLELKYLYPRVRDDDVLLDKLDHQERCCLAAADQVVTVSQVSKEFITGRGCPAAKVAVIPNGVDPAVFPYRELVRPDGGPLRLLYLGTLSAWQGVETLLRAVQLAKPVRPVRLALLGPAPRTRRTELARTVRRLGVKEEVQLLGARPQEEVAALLHQSHATVVPLLALDRNLLQGCCPLKMLEAMFAGCPVIASDLPVVRELAEPDVHFLPARAGVAASLAEAILRLAADAGLGPRLARQARQHATARFTWEQAAGRLLAVYEELLSRPPSNSASPASSCPKE
jgi:glycosyltransferase involved in cell wall biosynthesis